MKGEDATPMIFKVQVTPQRCSYHISKGVAFTLKVNVVHFQENFQVIGAMARRFLVQHPLCDQFSSSYNQQPFANGEYTFSLATAECQESLGLCERGLSYIEMQADY